jgi:hypothetical protein
MCSCRHAFRFFIPTGAQGCTALHYGIEHDQPAAAERLIEKGANVNAKTTVRA